ncbi:hypothetical protein OC844_004703 [Tilletia horrida]|nr:hypothetical protein OC844_004703 [Tilletia horrida]
MSYALPRHPSPAPGVEDDYGGKDDFEDLDENYSQRNLHPHLRDSRYQKEQRNASIPSQYERSAAGHSQSWQSDPRHERNNPQLFYRDSNAEHSRQGRDGGGNHYQRHRTGSPKADGITPPDPSNVIETWQLSRQEIEFIQRLSMHAVALNYYGSDLITKHVEQADHIADLACELSQAYKEIAHLQQGQASTRASADGSQEKERIRRIVARVRNDPEQSAKVLFNRNDLYRRDPMGILDYEKVDKAHPALKDILRTEDGERTSDARFDLILTSMRGIRARLRSLSFPSHVPDSERMTFALHKQHHQGPMDKMLDEVEAEIVELALGAGHWKPYEVLKKLLRKEMTVGERRHGRLPVSDDEEERDDEDTDDEDEVAQQPSSRGKQVPASGSKKSGRATATKTGSTATEARADSSKTAHSFRPLASQEAKASGFRAYSRPSASSSQPTGVRAAKPATSPSQTTSSFRTSHKPTVPIALNGPRAPIASTSRIAPSPMASRTVASPTASSLRNAFSPIASSLRINKPSAPMAGTSRISASPIARSSSRTAANLSSQLPRSPLSDLTNKPAPTSKSSTETIEPHAASLLRIIEYGFLHDDKLLKDMRKLLQRLQAAQDGKGPYVVDPEGSEAVTPLCDDLSDRDAMETWVQQLEAARVPEKEDDNYGSSFGHDLFKRGYGKVNWEEGLRRWPVVSDVELSLRILCQLVRLMGIAFEQADDKESTLLEGTLVPKVVAAMQSAWDEGIRQQEARKNGKRKADQLSNSGSPPAKKICAAATEQDLRALTVPQLKTLWTSVLQLPVHQYRKRKEDTIERLLGSIRQNGTVITVQHIESAKKKQ